MPKPERNGDPIDQATRDVPKRFYEITRPRLYQAAVGLSSVASSEIAIAAFHERPFAQALIGGTIYLASSLADRVSTTKFFKRSQELRERGVETGATEKNIFVRKKDEVEKKPPYNLILIPKLLRSM